jgi:hypothetical protein
MRIAAVSSAIEKQRVSAINGFDDSAHSALISRSLGTGSVGMAQVTLVSQELPHLRHAEKAAGSVKGGNVRMNGNICR